MSSTKPLKDVTVLEIGHSIAAPYAGMILGELGATVVKLENPRTGDYARDWGPPFAEGAATTFHSVNRGKRGITLDLGNPEEVKKLIAFIRESVDVVLHNLKFGAIDKYGLGGAELVALKPSLVYCNLGAFGAQGPLRERPGYDPLMQAFGGIMSILGEDGRPPVRVNVSMVDLATGMWAVIGILAALNERHANGRGGVVDTSLYETALAWMTTPAAAYLASGKLPKRRGSGTAEIVPYQAFPVADGHIMVAAGNDNLFRRLAKMIGQPELAEDPRFRTNKDRVVNRAELIPLLEKVFARHKSDYWLPRLEADGIPCAPLQTLDQVVRHPQTAALSMIQKSPDGTLSLMGIPLSFDGKRPEFERKAPKLGEHNEEILHRSKSR